MSDEVIKVPLYGIFGDNFIRQVAVEVGEYREVVSGNRTFIEVDSNDLLNVLKMASDRAKNMNKVVPMNNNDQGIYNKILNSLGLSGADPMWKVLSSYKPNNNDFVKDELSPISFLKPDIYEYARLPGKPGGTPARNIIKVSLGYTVLAMAGWVLSRLGSTQLNENEWVGVHAFSSVRTSLQTLIGHLLKVRKGLLPGIKPETALSLWLAINTIKANIVVDNFILEIYVVSDAYGRKSTTLKGGFAVNLSRLITRKELLMPGNESSMDSPYLERLATTALETNSRRAYERDFAIRFTNLVYEYVNGSRRLEDLLYYAYREYVVNMKGSDFFANNPARYYAYRYAEDLTKELGVR